MKNRTTTRWTTRLAGAAGLSLLLAAPMLAAEATRPRNSKFKPATQGGIANSYMVVLDEEQVNFGDHARAKQMPRVADVAARQAWTFGGRLLTTWESALPGYLIELDEAGAKKLAQESNVRWVEQNRAAEPLSAGAPVCSMNDEFVGFTPSDAGDPQELNCAVLDPRAGIGYECSDNWGLARIESVDIPDPENYVYDYDTDPTDVHIYIVDTGISADTDILPTARLGDFYNAAYLGNPSANNPNDCTFHGHGTHVAAIAAGNIFGVAREAIVHNVKFWERCPYPGSPPSPACPAGGLHSTNGNCGGDAASVIQGINWITANHESPAVVNLSLNFPTEVSTLSEAVQGLLGDGVALVQSAGNNFDHGRTGCERTVGLVDLDEEIDVDVIVAGGSDIVPLGTSPAIPTDVRWIREGPLTSSTTAEQEYLACQPTSTPGNTWGHCEAGDESINFCDCGSNTGSCVDLYAPAAHIVSAWRTGTVYNRDRCRLSGTSMAAPHVTGVAARILQQYPNATPAELQAALKDYAVKDKLLEGSSPAHYSIGVDPDNNLLLQTHMAPLAATYVNFGATGNIELGTQSLPWNTLTEGKNNVVEGTILRFKGTTSAGATFTTAVTLEAYDGPPAILGQP